jgi:cytochrome c peroxidase
MRLELQTLLLTALCAAGCAAPTDGGAIGVDVAAQKTKPGSVTTDDAVGQSSTAAPSAIDLTASNDFFHVFGTNGRTCGTCHKVDQGWSFTPAAASKLPATDPLFVLDGSDCLAPGQANPNPATSSKALLHNGLIRVEIPIPQGADFTLASYTDPLGCPTSPLTTGVLRMYRRPVPSANSAFSITIMWDGREPSLASQANDATLGHAQALLPLLDPHLTSVVAFESGTVNAQSSVGSSPAIKLGNGGVDGGADYLRDSVAPSFFPGINDSLSPGFSPVIFTLYQKWESSTEQGQDAKAAIGRGEALFNSRAFTISGIRGLNDREGVPASFTGTCGTCHDTPNVGNHSKALALDIGVTAPSPIGLDVALLPTYTFVSGSRTITVTDPGRGLISGSFDDLGKTKGPILRGLAARAPYFHNGSARDLATLVDFYDVRFGMGLSAGEKSDLVAFLNAL